MLQPQYTVILMSRNDLRFHLEVEGGSIPALVLALRFFSLLWLRVKIGIL
jgi:hypothetical protein